MRLRHELTARSARSSSSGREHVLQVAGHLAVGRLRQVLGDLSGHLGAHLLRQGRAQIAESRRRGDDDEPVVGLRAAAPAPARPPAGGQTSS